MSVPLLRAEARWIHELEHGTPREQAHAALRLAELARIAGRHGRAQRLLRTVLHEGDPVSAPRAAFELGDLMERDLGRPYGAERWFEQAAALSRPELTPDVHNNLALRLATEARYEQAIALYRQVVAAARTRDDEVLREEAAIAGFRLGDLLAEQGRRTEAEAVWRVVLASGEEEAVVHAALALAQLLADDQARHEEAASLLEAAIRTDHPDCAPLAALRLGALCERVGDDARALELYERVVACEHPEHAAPAAEALRLLRERQIEAYLTSVLDRGLPELGVRRDLEPDLILPGPEDLWLARHDVGFERYDEYNVFTPIQFKPKRARTTASHALTLAAVLMHHRALEVGAYGVLSDLQPLSLCHIRPRRRDRTPGERRHLEALSGFGHPAGIVIPNMAELVASSYYVLDTEKEQEEDEAWATTDLLAVLLAWTMRRCGGRGVRASRDARRVRDLLDFVITTARDARAQTPSPAAEPAIFFPR
jgi:tetratricopeptide (TPR) repeat protein